ARARALRLQRAHEAALRRQAAHNGGGGGGGYVAPSGGSWSPAAGREAVHRAMRYLGWMYAWAGGNSGGPTYGVCAGDGAYNDCHILGFDCSGLTLYGWAPFESMAHFAQSQYVQAGSVHPSTNNLRPGDLVFWSSNGAISGIHHVAMYIGGGNVIQAPQSGSVIQITALWNVSWGYLGATRPLT
ncbi:MAG: C40 family peptidase, partial [Jatrophihabitantaceae bacterium]